MQVKHKVNNFSDNCITDPSLICKIKWRSFDKVILSQGTFTNPGLPWSSSADGDSKHTNPTVCWRPWKPRKNLLSRHKVKITLSNYLFMQLSMCFLSWHVCIPQCYFLHYWILYNYYQIPIKSDNVQPVRHTKYTQDATHVFWEQPVVTLYQLTV